MLTPSEASALLKELLSEWEGTKGELVRLDRYYRGEFELPWVPPQARREYRAMLQRARMNWLRLVVTTIRQRLYVDGFRVADGEESDAEAWAIWQANGLDARQAAVHTDTLVFGQAFVVVWPDPALGARMSGESPLAMYARPFLDDPMTVEFAVKTATMPDGTMRAVVYDAAAAYRFGRDREQWGFIEAVPHGFGVTPVVRLLNEPDLMGRYTSEIEPLLPIQDRIVETLSDRLMTQKYGSFRQRWATGLVIPEDDNGQPIEPFNSAVSRLWIAEDTDVRFGEFAETPLGPYLDAVDADVRHMAALAQVPSAYLLGGMDNISADAIVAAEAGLMARVEDKQATFGECWESAMRLAMTASGNRAAGIDLGSEVLWRDTETRSPAVLVDTLTKLASIGVPLRFLLERYGLSPQTLDRVMRMTVEEPAVEVPAPEEAASLEE
jgi:hypothetical protein